MNNRRERRKPSLNKATMSLSAETDVAVKTLKPVVEPRTRQPVVEAVSPPEEPAGFKRGLVISVATVLLGLLVATLVVDRALHPDAFKLSKIYVEGALRNVDGEAVRAMADSALRADSGSNFFSVDLEKMERALKQVPWVAEASVRRRWPDTLNVEIIEAIPVAQWNTDEWIAQTGRLIKFSASQMPDKELPLLIGPSGDHDKIWQQYKLWQPALEQAGLNIKSLELNSRHAWKLKVFSNQRVALNLVHNAKSDAAGEQESATSTDAEDEVFEVNEVVLLLGKDSLDDRFDRFISGYKNNLRNDFYRVSQIDLRYPNGLALRWIQDKALAKDSDVSDPKTRARKDPVTGKNEQTSA